MKPIMILDSRIPKTCVEVVDGVREVYPCIQQIEVSLRGCPIVERHRYACHPEVFEKCFSNDRDKFEVVEKSK